MMMKKIFTFELLFMAILLFYTSLTNAEEAKKAPFGIITGEKVNMRDKPGTEGKITYQFLKGEIVLYEGSSEKETRIGDDVYRWHKVKTQYPWRKKCIRKGWQEIYKRNPTRLEGWVYGKYFKLLDGEISKEDRILKEIIDQKLNGKFENLTTLFFNPTLQIYTLEKKEYYIYTMQSQDYADDCQGNDVCIVYIIDSINMKYKKLRGTSISEYRNPFKIHDLDKDGFAEIFVFSLRNRGLSVYSEKQDRDIFEFPVPEYDEKYMRTDPIYHFCHVDLQDIGNNKCNIIIQTQLKKGDPIKQIIYKWNGETFVEEKK